MNRLYRIGALLTAFLFASASSAADLNAPLSDHPTLGSEIKRGWDAAFDCSLHNRNALADGQCISDASSAAQQQHSNFKPFELGLYFGEWQAEDLAAMSAQSLSNNVIAQQAAPEHARELPGTLRIVIHIPRHNPRRVLCGKVVCWCLPVEVWFSSAAIFRTRD